jgi:hypothetical protein
MNPPACRSCHQGKLNFNVLRHGKKRAPPQYDLLIYKAMSAVSLKGQAVPILRGFRMGRPVCAHLCSQQAGFCYLNAAGQELLPKLWNKRTITHSLGYSIG